MLSFPLDFVEIPESHTGETLSREFETMLRNFGLREKVCQRRTIYSMSSTYSPVIQLGHVTTDSASSNVVMVRNLGVSLPSFPGVVKHVRCLDHVVSLTAKLVISLFDVSTDGKNDSTLDSAEQALRELAEGLEIEESTHKVLADANEDDDDDLLREDDGGLGDPMAEIELSMSAAELAELRSSTIPVQTVLVKVRTVFVIDLL